ncbi:MULTISPECIES: FMN-binding negative transcriptional regulator [Roseobacteraceae]|uniref:Protease synthase and sporulation protein PAI 2 n=1 Tax=Pseudosulfitobacter pseudonitzschiae TaxID=1402135 RepID=A0A221JWQ8_9RHOB|nr:MULTISPECIES: FMN-binding negative transcriptional regulator [Roseobacteraceae]ASM71164.1 protease synthase and sporulation protein PAI 2 [Pseudosulfitobacter pseudonitzschiae]
MYQPAHHREDRLEVQHDLIEMHPFGLLISTGTDGLLANGLPFLLQRREGEFGRLQVHLARANPQWRGLHGQDVLVVFQGPLTYVTPAFYETKRETGKVVPTWNYVMVQARGTAQVRDDQAWLDTQIAALTDRHEAARAEPWEVSDAPRPYIESQLRGIVGIEIDIRQIEGKWKVSQNRPEADRAGVAQGLAEAHPDMAAVVRRYGNLED